MILKSIINIHEFGSRLTGTGLEIFEAATLNKKNPKSNTAFRVEIL